MIESIFPTHVNAFEQMSGEGVYIVPSNIIKYCNSTRQAATGFCLFYYKSVCSVKTDILSGQGDEKAKFTHEATNLFDHLLVRS